jgi:peptide chain release factor 3
MSLLQEINKRRTFAIISHPDAGKTTLTEKLLLFGGAIQTAGAVKSNKIKKTATSDFMEIEKQRGISVATSVMSFEYGGKLINILDTPGHKDFAEDTYRTLSAVDSVILVIDSVKGVEEQTERLMEVCRMRNTPVIIFINKLDREGKDPFALIDELEEKLNISTRPLTWPIGMGKSFQGVYNLYGQSLRLFSPSKEKLEKEVLEVNSLDDPLLEMQINGLPANQLRDDVEMIEELYEPLDEEMYREGLLAPVFFGSAVNNFGVFELLETFISLSPPPQKRPLEEGEVEPENKEFSGFVFKIHANLDPNHRDRIAFLRICSGEFERNKFFHHVRLDKKVRFSNPTSFMAQSKQIIERAFPGDVIGLYDSGFFKIGDSLSEGSSFKFKGVPSFSPEIFRELINKDPMKSKQLEKGIRQLTDEGVAQLFIQQPGNRKVVGTVGQLQFDVIQYRLQHEYGAKCELKTINFFKACWVTAEKEADLVKFIGQKAHSIYFDKQERPVFMAESQWMLNIAQENNPGLKFHLTSEFDS